MQPELVLTKIAIAAVPLLLSITLHEVAHGYVARQLGDRTAEMLGRLTLNPLKHVDPVGTVLVPLLLWLTTGSFFGWAKPVPIGVRNLKDPQRDMAVIGAAGPLANVAMAVGWALLGSVAVSMFRAGTGPAWLVEMCWIGVFFNAVLAVLNLIPIPPLDGGRVLNGFLSPRASDAYMQIERFGFVIIVVLLFSGVLWKIIWPLTQGMIRLVAVLTGFPDLQ